jgi:hypothetical protein
MNDGIALSVTKRGEFAELRYASGRTRRLTVHAEFTDGSMWATTGRNSNTGYSLASDGTVYKERYGSGRNAGEVLSSELLAGATWRDVSAEVRFADALKRVDRLVEWSDATKRGR